jgi:hypothetical protein
VKRLVLTTVSMLEATLVAASLHPGVADPKDAKAVHLDSGNVFGGIDFKLQRSPAVKVRGTISSIIWQAPAQATHADGTCRVRKHGSLQHPNG